MPLMQNSDQRKNISCFIRDDDVGGLTEELVHFTNLFLVHGIPVSYQVIPELFTAECAAFMLEKSRAHPGLIEFGQHGLTHHMELKGRTINREFGPEIGYDGQLETIRTGRDIMVERLGGGVEIRLFTPPQHKYDRNTVKAAAAVGHKVFSAAAYPSAHHRLAYGVGRALSLSSIRHHGISYHGRMRPEGDIIEMSVAIAVDDGGDILATGETLSQSIAAAAVHTRDVGLMFHHALYRSEAERLVLRSVVECLASAGGGLDIELLGDLARRLH